MKHTPIFNTYGEALDFAIRRYIRGAGWVKPRRVWVLNWWPRAWGWSGKVGYLEMGDERFKS